MADNLNADELCDAYASALEEIGEWPEVKKIKEIPCLKRGHMSFPHSDGTSICWHCRDDKTNTINL